MGKLNRNVVLFMPLLTLFISLISQAGELFEAVGPTTVKSSLLCTDHFGVHGYKEGTKIKRSESGFCPLQNQILSVETDDTGVMGIYALQSAQSDVSILAKAELKWTEPSGRSVFKKAIEAEKNGSTISITYNPGIGGNMGLVTAYTFEN